jgi:large-conductance mechanosensitive channel
MSINYDEFKKFIKDNNVVGVAAGMIIALATKDLISTIIGNLVVPGINIFLLTLNFKYLSKFLPGKDSVKSKIDFIPFINAILSFVLTVIITFLFILYTFNVLLGIK